MSLGFITMKNSRRNCHLRKPRINRESPGEMHYHLFPAISKRVCFLGLYFKKEIISEGKSLIGRYLKGNLLQPEIRHMSPLQTPMFEHLREHINYWYMELFLFLTIRAFSFTGPKSISQYSSCSSVP